MKILVIGGNGFLGSHFSKFKSYYRDLGVEIFSASEKIENKEDLVNTDLTNFQAVIFCSGIVNIEKCEENPTEALWVNSKLPALIANKLAVSNTKFIYISTDAVFDGTVEFATELDVTNPLSRYGESKLQGEKETLNASESNLVCRVNFVGKSPRNNSLLDYFLENLTSRKFTVGYRNVFFTPLYADDVVRGVIKLIQLDANGIFHLVGDDRMSKFEFGQIVEKLIYQDSKFVIPEDFKNSATSPKRSLDLSLSNKKARDMGIDFPSITSRLTEMFKNSTKG